MRISWLVNEVAGGWSPLDDRLGGTEEGIVEWSKRLVQKGHDVSVYHNGEHGNFDGVVYCDRNTYVGGGDVCINVKCPEQIPLEKTFYQTTETDAGRHDLSKFEAVIWPSKWAADNIPVNCKTVLLPYGYDPTKIAPAPKIAKTVLYASSPDRGLDTLLGVWPQVLKEVPDALLMVTYGASGDLPGVMFLGSTTSQEMDLLYATSDVWCHPANGGELYCITGIKAQASGCIPVYFPVMALSETVKVGIRSCHDTLAKDLIRTLQNQELKETLRLELKDTRFPTWSSTTETLLDILQS